MAVRLTAATIQITFKIVVTIIVFLD